MSSTTENVTVVVHYDAYVTECAIGIEFKGEKNVLVSMKRGMNHHSIVVECEPWGGM